MKLSEIISNYRKENGLSMDEFAQKCNLSKGYISMIERDTNPRNDEPISPTFITMQKIAKGMSMETDELIAMLDHGTAMNLHRQKMNDYRAIDQRLLQLGNYEKRLMIEKLAVAYFATDENTQKIIRMLLHIDGGEQ